MSAAEKLRALYAEDGPKLCPCQGYENRVWYDHIALPQIVAVVGAAEQTKHLYGELKAALADLDEALT